jgi:hypothetical protein
MGVFGIKTDVLINTLKGVVMVRYLSQGTLYPSQTINFLSNEPPFRNSTTLKIPQSLLCGGSLATLA